jgi:hypothetical protein
MRTSLVDAARFLAYQITRPALKRQEPGGGGGLVMTVDGCSISQTIQSIMIKYGIKSVL